MQIRAARVRTRMRREQAGTIMSGDFGPRSDLARVRAVSDDGRRLYLEYRHGQIATVDSVGYYFGADELYTLQGIRGIWNEPCLEEAED